MFAWLSSPHQQVEQAKRADRFRGPVVGPIGAYLKIAPGKEPLAKIAERALGWGVLDRFIVTNDEDRKELQNIRKAAGCSGRDCNIFQTPLAARYQVPEPPCDGIETVASTLNISNDLVFNCLVDNCRIDQNALATSKEQSEEALLIQDGNGKESMRVRLIQMVYFLPHGDFWHVKGGYRTMVSNDSKKGLKQTIGIDRTAAIAEAKREKDALHQEVEECKAQERRVKERAQVSIWTLFLVFLLDGLFVSDLAVRCFFALQTAQRKWNEENIAVSKIQKRIQHLEREIDDIKTEQENAQNYTIDTTELEEDVRNAEESLTQLKAKEAELERTIQQSRPALDAIKRQHEEVTARNERVIADMAANESAIEQNARDYYRKQQATEKRREKLSKLEDGLQKTNQSLVEEREKMMDALAKARLLTLKTRKERQQQAEEGKEDNSSPGMEFSQVELEAVEPARTTKEPQFYQAKVERALKQIERERAKRQITEVDGAVLYEKYQRAKKDLDAKLQQIEIIDENVNMLVADMKARKERWINFRKHIAKMTSSTFDDMLNKKGSSGTIMFDHDAKTLNLVVQKDNSNEMTQTSDVKALSGGERSFTTLSLLLALGENLETPFRVSTIRFFPLRADGTVSPHYSNCNVFVPICILHPTSR